jgi:hypothetical protein
LLCLLSDTPKRKAKKELNHDRISSKDFFLR